MFLHISGFHVTHALWENRKTTKTHWETDTRLQPLASSLDKARSCGMGAAQIPLGIYHGKLCNATVLLIQLLFKEVNITVPPTQADQSPGCAGVADACRNPISSSSLWDQSLSPQFQAIREPPQTALLGGYIWSIRSRIFVMSEYRTARHGQHFQALSSQQAAITPHPLSPHHVSGAGRVQSRCELRSRNQLGSHSITWPSESGLLKLQPHQVVTVGFMETVGFVWLSC